MIRKPAVAGQFYPENREELKKLISSFGVKPAAVKEKVIACILPHAGYIYSGRVAAAVLSSAEIGDTCVVIGPNHTGYGYPASIMREGSWQTPFGCVNIDTELADLLIRNTKILTDDDVAQIQEHSIEVELPLLQEFAGHDFAFVPIILAWNEEIELNYRDIAKTIAASVKSSGKKVTLIASSDMTHYEPQKDAEQKDHEAIASILRLDDGALLEKIDRLGISMCGAMPAAVVVSAAKNLGATKARLVLYQTSADATGDDSSVVGYAGIVIT